MTPADKFYMNHKSQSDPEELAPQPDKLDRLAGYLISFLAGVGFLFTCFALGLWGVK